MNSNELKQKLEKHAAWLRDEEGGERANLTGANLTDADLTDADLTRANLTDADLTDADLTGANLTGANLTRANLTRANLTRANLTDADLTDANLTDADLTDADLTRPNGWLKRVREDLWKVLSWSPAEAPAVLKALEEGRIDGSTYAGPCACLVGTLAQAKGAAPQDLPSREDAEPGELACDSSSPAEQFFQSIRPGHTPDFSTHAALAAGWVREFIARRNAAAVQSG